MQKFSARGEFPSSTKVLFPLLFVCASVRCLVPLFFDVFQGRSQGRVPGVLEAPFWVMKMNIISRGKTYRNPLLEIPRDEIFVFGEEQKKINEHSLW